MRTIAVAPESIAGELVALWNRSAGGAFPLDERLLGQQLRLDTDPRLCVATMRPDGTIGAAVLAKRAARTAEDGHVPETGYLSFLAVDDDLRRRGLGGKLLGAATKWLTSLGATRLEFGGDQYHLLPGRPMEAGPGYEALEAFLLAHGFAGEGVEYDLTADLVRADWPRKVDAPADGRYRFKYYESADREAALRFMEDCFPGRWAHELREAIDAGLRGSDLILAVDAAGGDVIGFSRVYDEGSPLLGPGVYWRALMGDHPGGLGPIGVDPAWRGIGLGLALLERCVRDLARRGVATMVIDWTDLVGFYGKLGFTVWKRYERMSKRIAPGFD